MKAVVILFFVIAYFQGKISTVSAYETLIERAREEKLCIQELNLDLNETRTLNREEIVPEDNEDFNKFLACYYQKLGLQDETTGDIKWANLVYFFNKRLTRELKIDDNFISTLIKHIVLSNVLSCQRNPPPKGATHGQTVARTQNCVARKVSSAAEEFGV